MIIGIGGISTAGKSKLANRLKEYFSDKKVSVLCQDNYAMPTAQIPMINGHTNWEIPESLDFDKFYNLILEEKKSNDIVIAEGLFVFYEKRLLELFDKKIFMTISKETFLERKSIDLRWGKEPEWYMEHIWKSHHNYCSSVEARKDTFILSGENPIKFDKVIHFLET
jgi:nicotinamide/nicotinate riboside kinase